MYLFVHSLTPKKVRPFGSTNLNPPCYLAAEMQMKLRDCMIFGNSLEPFSKIDWENDQGPKGSCRPLKAGVSSARRSCRPWSSKLQKVLVLQPRNP